MRDKSVTKIFDEVREPGDIDHYPKNAIYRQKWGHILGERSALFKPETAEMGERKMRIMAGLASVLLENPQLAEAGDAAIVEPWATINRILMMRARDRGEISANADINAVSRVIPSMAAYRALIQRKPFDLQFLTTIIDGVLLPALSKAE